MKIVKTIQLKIVIFTPAKNGCILHWRVFVMTDVHNIGFIMITQPCKLYLLAPHFYVVKLGFTGVYIFFLYFPDEAVPTCTHNLCFE